MKTKITLWVLMILDAVIAIGVTGYGLITGQSFVQIPLFRAMLLGIPFILTCLHAMWNFGFKRGVSFLLLSALIGFLAEVLGVNFGLGFGGNYSYRTQTGMIWGVPLTIPIYWAIFIYTSNVISTSCFGWFGIPKPRFGKRHALFLILLLAILDGILTMNIDMALDPLQTVRESWTWFVQGPYFGIPIGNFVGWFLVAIIASGLFRIFEGINPQKNERVNDPTLLLPTIGYGILAISIILMSIQLNHPEYALIAISTMAPIFIVSNILFLVRPSSRKT